jgi:hypothetical protein
MRIERTMPKLPIRPMMPSGVQVGDFAELMTRSHGVSGTLTVTDDRTLTLTNFNYDGRGRDVRVLLAKDGDYRNGILVGPQLLRPDQPYVDEMLTITLPEGLSLSDFNSVSIWCVAVGSSFGDGMFHTPA